jgi:hypothetical protein
VKNHGRSSTRGGAPARHYLSVICAGVLTLFSPVNLAQGDQTIRRIAPERFPELRLGDDSSAGQRDRPFARPGPDRPLGSCDRERRDWIPCLNATAALAETMLDEAIAEVETGLARRAVPKPQLDGWGRALKEANQRYRALRNYECQMLALSEPGTSGELYEARLVCTITKTIARIGELRTRYGLPEP